jgi:hypothetical protein
MRGVPVSVSHGKDRLSSRVVVERPGVVELGRPGGARKIELSRCLCDDCQRNRHDAQLSDLLPRSLAPSLPESALSPPEDRRNRV